MRVALATSAKWPNLGPDDAPLLSALQTCALRPEPAVWSDDSVDWDRYQAILIRSCWDYHLRPHHFLRWATARGDRLLNPPQIVQWNSHKQYLLELGSRGVLIPRSQLVARQSDTAVSIRAGSWIIKPAVSASAYETHHCSTLSGAEAMARRLSISGDVMVQEFIPEVITKGEWSLIFIGGMFSHAVLKRPAPNDFRVQQELGGSAVLSPAPDHLLVAAEAIWKGVELDCLYARIDMVDAAQGPLLMELELIEPVLFFSLEPRSAAAMAEGLLRRIERPHFDAPSQLPNH